MTRHGLRAALATVLVCAALTACAKKEEPAPRPAATAPAAAAPVPAAAAPKPSFALSSIDLGKEIGADKKVTEPATVFSPADTIYASVATIGASPGVTLKARWTYEDGQVVNESSQTIAPAGPAVTEFHIAKASGWPTGKYQVAIDGGGAASGTKSFEVR
jgi:hypothetical protein